MVAIILSLFVIGLKYMDPPIEYGITINFGTSNVGRGKVQTKAVLKRTPTKIKKDQKKAEPNVKKQIVVKEKVLTQDKVEAPIIAKEIKKNIKKTSLKKKVTVKNKIIPKPKPDKTTTDILSNLISGQKNKAKTKEGEGDDDKQGNKGQKDGDLNTKNDYGKGGKGGGGNYNLGNRRPLLTPKPIYDCNEEGRVVVGIEVDNAGHVISANAGVKGSTTSAPCLLIRAKSAALKTMWQPDANAPNKQIGSIIYNFSLSN